MPDRFSRPALFGGTKSYIPSSRQPLHYRAGLSELSNFSWKQVERHQAVFTAGLTAEEVDAIRCQAMVLEVFMDIELDYDALVDFIRQQEWYRRAYAYSAVERASLVLELNGVAVTRYQRASVYHLAHELAQGHMVILGVEYRNDSGGRRPNSELHSTLRVLQIDTTNPEGICVLIHEPVTRKQIASYPLEQFLSYWRDRRFFMVATAKAMPIWAKGMANFDYGRGSLESILGTSFAEFLAYEAYPHTWRMSILPDVAYLTNNACESLRRAADVPINDEVWLSEVPDSTSANHRPNPTLNI